MQPSPRRPIGLLLAAALAFCLVVWLSANQTQAIGLHQETSIVATDQPSVIETPDDFLTPPPVEIPTDTPIPPPIQELPTEIPTEMPVETPTEFPTETPTETPTPEPTNTPQPPTETPTQTPTATPTVRPVVLSAPTPDTTLYGLAGRVLNTVLTSAAWIWLTCGSLVFFAVAGAIAGLSVYNHRKNRFNLYEIVPEEEVELLAPKSEKPESSHPSDEDSWPSSLP